MNFFNHVLQRLDWRRDLHFQTKTTIDTLDYSGSGWNQGSKVIMACSSKPIRSLGKEKPTNLSVLSGFKNIEIALPGVLAISAPKFENYENSKTQIEELVSTLKDKDLTNLPLIVLTEDANFLGRTLNNFLWVTFTRCNPSHDIYGVNSFTKHKHWGCKGPLILDSRIKSFHAPILETDKVVSNKVDEYFKKGGLLDGII